jgi:hypothetical protein
MIGRFQIVLVLYMLLILGAMVAVWVLWVPRGEFQPIAWWIVEIVLGIFAFKSLVALILTGGMKKHFREF